MFCKFDKFAFFESIIEKKNLLKSKTENQRFNKITKITFKEQIFQNFIIREFSRFEHVKMKTTILYNKVIDSKIERVIQRADTIFKRKKLSRQNRVD